MLGLTSPPACQIYLHCAVIAFVQFSTMVVGQRCSLKDCKVPFKSDASTSFYKPPKIAYGVTVEIRSHSERCCKELCIIYSHHFTPCSYRIDYNKQHYQIMGTKNRCISLLEVNKINWSKKETVSHIKMNCILAVASIRVPVKVTSSRTGRSVRKAQKQIV